MDDATQENQPLDQTQVTNQSESSPVAEILDDAQKNGSAPPAPAADLNKLDLSQLQGFSFGTKWESKPEEKREPSYGAGGTGRRGFGDNNRDRRAFANSRENRSGDSAPAQRDRRGFRKPQGANGGGGDFSQRSEPQNGSAAQQQDRRNSAGAGERRNTGRSAQDGAAGHSFGRRAFAQEGARRGGPAGASGAGGAGGRFYQQNRDAVPPPYESPHFAVSFYPEDTSFAALAKTIRSSYRTLELFEIARTVVAKNDRFIALLTRKPATSAQSPSGGALPQSATASSAQNKSHREAIYIARPDGVPFDSEEAVINYVVSQHIGQFFETEQVQVDPPKGNFQVINRCGVTGELLGPPNYHRYNQIVQQHFEARIKHLSFDAFHAKIETLRDETAVAEWLEKMKTVTRYTWRVGKKKAEAIPPKVEETVSVVTEAEKSTDSEALSARSETPAAENQEPKPEVAASAADVSAPEVEATDVLPTSGTPEKSVEDTSAPSQDGAEMAGPTGATFDSLEEAKVYLLTHARDKVYRTSDTARFHGNLLEKLPEGEIRRAIEGALERQRRFPLDTANGLRGRLRREHFTIFKKGSKGISYVCAVKRKFRTPGQTFADSISALIEFIEKHPMVLVSELPERFLGIKAEPAQPATLPPSASEDGAQVEKGEAAATATASAESAKDAVAEREALHRLQLDLRWLVTEGYVMEFMDGRLFAAPPVPESRKHAAENPDTPDLENFPDVPKPKASAVETSSKTQAQPEVSSSAEPSPAAVPESVSGDGYGQAVAPEHPIEPSDRAVATAGLSEELKSSAEAASPSTDAPTPPAP